MNEKYQIEIQEFEKNFQQFKDKKIVLYGIGRYTATLLEGEKDFHFVGLMDKDPAKVGKIMFGLPILDMAAAEREADLVVINTSETYWNVIYERIVEITIPVFYKNGQKAEKKEQIHFENPYRNLNMNELCKKIENAEVVSFDFFDTLFMRCVCNPRDIFRLLECEITDIWKSGRSFVEIRNEAINELPEDYSFDELYLKIEKISGLSPELVQNIKKKEISIEQKLLVPRTEIVQFLKEICNKKTVYVVSDMYLPREFYLNVLQKYGINFRPENILISNELHKSKSDGSLWDYFAKEILQGRKAVHIGDNESSDCTKPKQYGISTYQTPGVWSLLDISSLRKVESYICRDFDSAVIGCILKKLFQNPYVLAGQDGVLKISSNRDMGYLVFGPVLMTFLLWLKEESQKDKIQTLVFMSRDGYFLKEDYEFLCGLLKEQANCSYLGISRQLAMSASISSEKDLMEYITMPYSGTIKELFEDRFDLHNIDEIPNGTLEQYLECYGAEIKERLSGIRKNYLQYLKKMQLDEKCAIVDLGFYGNNQRYLNKLLYKNLIGYYFNANLSENNINTKYQKMSACFQTENDLTGEHSQIQKKMIFIESVLTAPYGMVKEVDEKGKFLCAKKQHNQIYFDDKKEINEGIKDFIYDYVMNFSAYHLQIHREFIDWYYGYCMDGAFVFADSVKHSFYNDNAMMNRIESMLFY